MKTSISFYVSVLLALAWIATSAVYVSKGPGRPDPVTATVFKALGKLRDDARVVMRSAQADLKASAAEKFTVAVATAAK